MSGPTLADLSGFSPGGAVNPITLEVVRSAVYSIAEEMRVIVMRSARSPLLKEAGDLSSVLTDATGRLIAQGDKDIPYHADLPVRRERADPRDARLRAGEPRDHREGYA